MRVLGRMAWSHLSRFLDSKLVGAVIVLLAHTIITVLAWTGSMFAFGVMTVSWFFWTGLALLNAKNWRGTVHEWRQTLDAWNESNKLIDDYQSLLLESCTKLSTWDREAADDLMERTSTITIMRAQNIERRTE
jgi:hypothetical protein